MLDEESRLFQIQSQSVTDSRALQARSLALNRSFDQINRLDKDQRIMASILGHKFKESLLNDRGNIFNYSEEAVERFQALEKHSLLKIKNEEE